MVKKKGVKKISRRKVDPKKNTKKKVEEKNKLWVISLGGSRIVPDDVDTQFLVEFRELIKSHPSHKFVVITGGGSTARRYISSLRYIGKKTKDQSMEGIAVTRLHAGFLSRIFGKRANEVIPKNKEKVKNLLRANQVVFTGALRYKPNNTSDGLAAELAEYLSCPFINITDVKGLYTKNPKKHKDAKFTGKITWKKFDAIASKIKYEAGQHFVLDQSASKRILEHKIPTYIVGNLQSIHKIIQGKANFGGTLISG